MFPLDVAPCKTRGILAFGVKAACKEKSEVKGESMVETGVSEISEVET